MEKKSTLILIIVMYAMLIFNFIIYIKNIKILDEKYDNIENNLNMLCESQNDIPKIKDKEFSEGVEYGIFADRQSEEDLSVSEIIKKAKEIRDKKDILIR